MRYIIDANNYIKAISFGCQIECQDDVCTEYTGSVPKGYTSLVDWYAQEEQKLYRWKIINGNLSLNSGATPPKEGTGVYNGDYNDAPLGTWWTQPANGACANYPEGVTYGFLTTVKVNNLYSQTYTQYSSGKTWFRSYVNSKWSSWFRQDGLDCAPSGYGLGTGGVYDSSPDDTFNGGFYRWDTDNDQTPFSNGSYLVIPRAKDTSAFQLAVGHAGNTKGVMTTRATTATTVTEWEYINPPMALGVEYRTVERWKNSPVYVKALNVGYVTAGSNSFTHGCAMAQPLAVEVYNNDSELVTGYSGITSLTCDRTSIHMACNNDFGNITFYLKYTK